MSYLRKICENVRDNPEEQKYRKVAAAASMYEIHAVIAAVLVSPVQDGGGWGLQIEAECPPISRPCSMLLAQIRVSNKTFGLHVRDAPGGEEYMHEAGWRVKVCLLAALHWPLGRPW